MRLYEETEQLHHLETKENSASMTPAENICIGLPDPRTRSQNNSVDKCLSFSELHMASSLIILYVHYYS